MTFELAQSATALKSSHCPPIGGAPMIEIDTCDRRGSSLSSFPSMFADVDSLVYKHKPRRIDEETGVSEDDDEDCTEATTQTCDETSFLSGTTSMASDSHLLADALSGIVLVDLDEEEGAEGAYHNGDEKPAGSRSGTVSPIPSCTTSDEEEENCDEDEDDDSVVFPPITFPAPPPRRDSSSPSTMPRRSSLRRESLSDDNVHIHTKRGCWKVLPAPDVATIKTSRSLSCLASAAGHELSSPQLTTRRPRSVSFGDVHMRSYEQTLGDNPSVSYGPPISLDWRFLELPSLSLDQYEATKKAPRKPREMVLNYYNRKHLLSWKFGFSEDELKRASRDANKCKRERAVTRALLPTSKLEDLFESARRKAVRRVSAGPPKRDSSK